ASYPILSEQDAMCLQELSCFEIHGRGFCEAVQQLSDEPDTGHGAPSFCH
ncbi:MAG: hypothetical protein JRI68_06470, partial [Deltaproteobacteria bacterium]|nr:hypothetical protein [Deltaproteobacteria bacterium]